MGMALVEFHHSILLHIGGPCNYESSPSLIYFGCSGDNGSISSPGVIRQSRPDLIHHSSPCDDSGGCASDTCTNTGGYYTSGSAWSQEPACYGQGRLGTSYLHRRVGCCWSLRKHECISDGPGNLSDVRRAL